MHSYSWSSPVGRNSLLVLAIPLLMLWSAQSDAGGGARHIQVDFGFNSSDPSQSENDPQGESWNPVCDTTPGAATTSCILDYTTPASTAISTANVPIGFDVKLGSNIFSQVHLNKNGVLTFDVDVAHPVLLGAFAPESTLSALASLIGANNPFIAAFYPTTTALNIPLADGVGVLGQGGAEYGRGIANPTGAPAGPANDDGGFPTTGDVPAFKATWIECTTFDCNATNPAQVRVILYKRYGNGIDTAGADGDFDLRFEFNSDYNNGSGQNGIIGFGLGSTASLVSISSPGTSNPVPNNVDLYYQFRNGQLVGAVAQATVPNVIGQPQSVAATIINAVTGLTVGTVTLQSSTTVPAGSVISESPAAGAKVTPPATVSLVVSSGAPAPLRGDINGDGQVDKLDVALVTAALNKPAAANDPRDLDHNGVINVVDARLVATLCTHQGCTTN